jgi:hypothetical protein
VRCMRTYGWVLDHVIPDPPSAYVHTPSYGSNPPVDNSNDEAIRRQQEQDNIQQWTNQQNQSDIQRMNQEQFDQQQQIINNNRLGDP